MRSNKWHFHNIHRRSHTIICFLFKKALPNSVYIKHNDLQTVNTVVICNTVNNMSNNKVIGAQYLPEVLLLYVKSYIARGYKRRNTDFILQ